MEEINIDVRAARAAAFFKAGYNCSQSVVLAYADLYGMDMKMAATIASSFGAGMGRLREVCGAVSGMFVLAGLHCPAADPTDRVSKTANYALVQALAAQFRSENGSIVCRELLGLDRPKADSEGPRPELRTADYYAKRPCVKCVESAARIFGQKITSKL